MIESQYRDPKNVDPLSTAGRDATVDLQTRLSKVPARPTAAAPSEFQATLADFMTHPDLVKKFGAGPIGFDKYKQSQRLEEASVKSEAANAGAVELTPAGLDAAALAFSKSGNLPAMGNGKESTRARSKIINRAAELSPGLDIVSAKADLVANQDSLKTLQKQADAVQAFESTALKNTAPLLASAKKIIDSGSPLINLPLREAAAKAAGSGDQAVFNAALDIVTTEYAKIINNPNLSGQLSDSARTEVKALIPEGATLKQVVDVTNLLKNDSENRRTSLAEQIAAIRDRIKKGANPAPVDAVAPVAAGKPMSENLIKANMRANGSLTRQQVIDNLVKLGYTAPPK